MKQKHIFAIALTVILIAGTFVGCGVADIEDLMLYEHPVGVSLRMEEGFTETEVEGLLACYEGPNANVRIEEEAFATLEALGYSITTEEDYAQLILDAYQLNGIVETDEYGNVYIAYTEEIQGTTVAYYAFFDKGEYSFWTTTFMCLEAQAQRYLDDFHLWASTIDTSRAQPPVVEPIPEALTEEETEDLLAIIEKIEPIDFLGKSFKTEELTNDEMLRLTYDIFGAQEYGIVGIEGNYFRESIAKEYFGYDNLEMTDMICGCGATLATYDADQDQYSWDGTFHNYEAHTCDVYNEYLEAYKLEEQYIVSAYKLFPDLIENSSTDTIHFYVTYEDAKNQQDAVVTAANEEELTEALASIDPAELVIYTYFFEKDAQDRFILVEYSIGE